MLWIVIVIFSLILVAVAVILINKQISKKSVSHEKNTYGASFGDCTIDPEELKRKSEELKKKNIM